MKKVWILNHYATGMFYDRGGRHYNFAKHLLERGYRLKIFCADRVHNSDVAMNLNGARYLVRHVDDIPFVFVKSVFYKDNGMQRVLNMFSFYRNLIYAMRQCMNQGDKPDVIIASSPHPLTLIAGILIGKRFGIPCICEVRDLWPESIVAYGLMKKGSLLSRILYRGEKWIYQNATQIIFTMQGGAEYIIDKGWDKGNGGPIDLNKVHYINNGVDLKAFRHYRDSYIVDDPDLNREDTFKVVYAGSIRRANNLKKLVDTARVINELANKKVIFLVFGDGTEKEELEQYVNHLGLDNIKFKGVIEKSQVPYALSKAGLNIMFFRQNSLKKYGGSLNKLFEYFANGRPTLSDCMFGYDLITKYKAGRVVDNATPKELAKAIVEFKEMPKTEYSEYCSNAIKAAEKFDFTILTDQLVAVMDISMSHFQNGAKHFL